MARGREGERERERKREGEGQRERERERERERDLATVSSRAAHRQQLDEVLPIVPDHQHLFRGGFVFKAHRLCVSLNSRLESDKEEEEKKGPCKRQGVSEGGERLYKICREGRSM